MKGYASKEGAKVVDYCPSCQTQQLRTYVGRLVDDETGDWRCIICDAHYFPDTDIRYKFLEQLQEGLKGSGMEVKFETGLDNLTNDKKEKD